MKSILLVTHLVFAGIWLGCVLTEALFERALLGSGRAQELILVRLHQRVDRFIEIPAFLIVLATGGLMLLNSNPDPVLYAKISFGLLAIAANAYCVWLVWRRADAATADDWAEFSRLDHLQHKFGAVVLIGIVLALGIGVYLFVAP